MTENISARYFFRRLVSLLILTSLFGCSMTPTLTTAPSPTIAQATSPPRPTATSTPQAFSDPFAYCAAVINADTPDARYTGEKTPGLIVANLRKTLGTPTDAPDEIFLRATFWRCMNGQVYACFVGANLPCQTKANLDKAPTQAIVDFCKQNPNAQVIPMTITGRETVYEWQCQRDTPIIARQFAQLDARGFIANIWYEIKAN